MGKFISLSEKYYTEKIKSLITMANSGVPVPDSIVLSSDNLDKMDYFIELCKEWRVDQVYLRLCFSDIEYPHYISEMPLLKEIEKTLINLYGQIDSDKFDIICQPMLNDIKWSGGLIKYKNHIYIEFVYGMGATLFRDGEIYGRILLNDTSEIKKFYEQNVVLQLKNRVIFKMNCNKISDKIPNYSKLIKGIDFCENTLYEFGVLVDNSIIFFDGKKVNTKIYFNKIKKGYMIADTKENLMKENYIYLSHPKLEDLEKIIENTKVYIKKGPVLSHVCSFMIQKEHEWECFF